MAIYFIKTLEYPWINAAYIKCIYIQPYYIKSSKTPTKYQVFAQMGDEDFLLYEDDLKGGAEQYVHDLLERINKTST